MKNDKLVDQVSNIVINTEQREKESIETCLAETGYLAYKTHGVSMRPLIRQDIDVVQISKKGIGRCKKFDVILYKVKDKYFLHRIIEVREKDYIILGDNCLCKEYGITDEQILGVLIGIIRNGKQIRTTDKVYLLYVHLWCATYPLRYVVKFTSTQLYRVKRKILSFIENNLRRNL